MKRRKQRIIYVREKKSGSGCLIIVAWFGFFITGFVGIICWPLWLLSLCLIMIALFAKGK